MAAFHRKDSNPLNLLSTKIESDRVVLTPVSREHAPDIFREFTAEITRYMLPKPVDDIGQVNAFIETSRENMLNGSDLILTITENSSGEFLGICGLHSREHSDSPELGIWLKKSAHGARLGREAIHVLAIWARDNLSISYLLYPVDKDNVPSRKIAEYLGGIVIDEGVRQSMAGIILNEVVYQIDTVRLPRYSSRHLHKGMGIGGK